ncbi:MAG: LPS export ABC transporter periplasmic protein LptC [Methyloceanibacter sp.]
MTLEADLGSAGRRYRVRTADERERAFVRAERHSRVVQILRQGLPVLAVVVLAAYFVSTQLSVTVGDMTASISGVEVSGGNLRMTNPKLKGADKKNGDYIVSAEYADQDVRNPKIVKLHAMKADVTNPSGGWSHLRAARGVFNTQAERLVMQDKITIATSADVTGVLKHATLDMKSQTLRSHRPVSFVLSNGTVRANAMTLRSGEKTLIFRGKVKVNLVRQTEEGDKPSVKKALPKPEAAVSGAATGPETSSGRPATVSPQ